MIKTGAIDTDRDYRLLKKIFLTPNLTMSRRHIAWEIIADHPELHHSRPDLPERFLKNESQIIRATVYHWQHPREIYNHTSVVDLYISSPYRALCQRTILKHLHIGKSDLPQASDNADRLLEDIAYRKI